MDLRLLGFTSSFSITEYSHVDTNDNLDQHLVAYSASLNKPSIHLHLQHNTSACNIENTKKFYVQDTFHLLGLVSIKPSLPH